MAAVSREATDADNGLVEDATGQVVGKDLGGQGKNTRKDGSRGKENRGAMGG